MMLRSLVIFYFSIKLSDGNTKGTLYNRYNALPTTAEDLSYYEKYGAVSTCTIEIKPCNESDWRHVDGSCNNLKLPARGSYFVPMERILPAHYYNGSYERKSESGEDLPLPRFCRTTLLAEGVSHHPDLTQHVPFYAAFMFMDFSSGQDLDQYLYKKTDCCEKEHMNDYECTPNIVPDDDPVHRFSNVRCLNLTRPLTYQDYHCTRDSIPAPIVKTTVSYDLSNIYDILNKGIKEIRSFSGGELIVEEEDGKIWPPSGPISDCPLNEAGETRCYKNYVNSLLPVNLFTVWFLRNHNHIAKKLTGLNPCWDDERLFQTARDLNIAISQQIYFYEWLTVLIGRKDLIKADVISDHPGFRDIYDEDMYPCTRLEFSHTQSWFHLIVDSTANLHDTDGTLIGTFPLNNLTLRTGWIPKDNRMTYLTQGSFRQPCQDSDRIVHTDMAERGVPGVQHVADIMTSNLHKSRTFGLAPYVDYFYLWSGIKITCFDDLLHVMAKDNIVLLKMVYKHVRDIDLIAGLWLENKIKGGRIPETFAHIMMDSMAKSIKGDRHWFERRNRPHAFTAEQLREVRKSSLSMLLCNVGDGVKEIQKNAFLNISPKNPLISCSKIPQIDYTAWRDPSCSSNTC